MMAKYGDEIAYSDDEIRVNGRRLDRLLLTNASIAHPENEPEIWRETGASKKSYQIMLPQHPVAGTLVGMYKIETGCFFAGDNRMASYDSRQRGPLQDSIVRGKLLLVLESERDDALLGHWIKWVN